MGVWLYTGLPGAGKSLAVVQEIVEVLLKPDGDGKQAPVYAAINGLDYDKLGVRRLVPEDEDTPEGTVSACRKWYECEEGAFIVIDECQRVFPVRNAAAAVPRYVSEFETHRHKGFNILLITQGPALIDKHVRTLVERHVHFKRTFNLERSLRIEWPAVEENPQSRFAVSRGITSNFRFPKKYFGLYQSATVHNQQRRLPWKLFAVAVFWVVLTLGGFGYYFLSLSGNTPDSPVEPLSAHLEPAGLLPPSEPPSSPCAVSISSVVGDRLFFTDLATGIVFELPDYVAISREAEADYLFNPRTARKYLICS